MTTYNTDTFVRSNVSGSWGTATDGTTWSHVGSGTPNVTSNEGVIPSTPGNSDEFYLGSTHTDEEVLVRFSINVNVDTAMALLRYNSGTDSGYWMGYDGQVSSGHIYITANNGGAKTTITSTSMTLSSNTFYWIRAQAISTNVKLRIWQDGNSEPSSWSLTATSSTYSSGYAGVVANSNGTGIKFDHFTSTSGAATTTVSLVDDALSTSEAKITVEVFVPSEPLSTSETVSIAPIFVPVDDPVLVETIFVATSFTVPIEQNTVGETGLPTGVALESDTLSTTDSLSYSNSAAGSEMIVPDIALSVIESAVFTDVYITVETLSQIITEKTALTVNQTEVAGTYADSITGQTFSLIINTDQLIIGEPDSPVTPLIIFTLADSIPGSVAIPSDSFARTGEMRPADSLIIAETFASSTATNVSLPDAPVLLSEAQQMTMVAMGSDLSSSSDTLSYALFSAIIGTDQLTLPSDSIAFYNTPILIDDPLTTTDAIVYSYTFIPGNISGSKVYSTDTFARTVSANSWGSASDGTSGAWTTRRSTGITYSVNGSQGLISGSGSTLDIVLGSQTYADCDYQADIQFGSSSDGTVYQLIIRADSGTQGIYIGFTSQTAFAIARNDGTYTTVVSKTIAGIAANTTYHVRARVVGTTAFGKYWQAGTAEPAAWTVQTTTGITVTAAGKIGVTCSPGTTATNIFDNVYVMDYALVDGAATSDSLNPIINPALTDALSTNDNIVTAGTGLVTLSDVPLSSIEVIASPITLQFIDTAIPPSDTGTHASYPVGMYDANSTPITETFSSTLVQPESGTFTLAEAVTYNTILAPTEQLNETEQEQQTLTYSVIELLALHADRVAPLFVSPLFDDGLLPTDRLSYENITAPVETVIAVENAAYGMFFTNIPEQSTVTDAVVFAYPIPLPDTPITVVDASTFTLIAPKTDQLIQAEQYMSVIAEFGSDSLAVVNPAAYALFSQIQDSDDALTIIDSVIGGQPAFLNDVALIITEQQTHGGYFPLSDPGDTLIVFEGLYVLNNLTDIVVVQESILATTEIHQLDRRADQYSTIVSDGPSAYYQCNENSFTGIFQRDGQDRPANASISALAGAVLPYTWAQIEPQEGNYNWTLIDNDIAAWDNQDKQVILRIFSAGTVAGNNKTHYNNTAGNATPAWLYNTYGVRSVTETDGSVYPVYWDSTYQQKFSDFITAFGLRYDTSTSVAAVVVGVGCFGQTSLDQSGNPGALALWQYQGYTPDLWTQTVDQLIHLYQQTFAHTPIVLSVDSAYLVPDVSHNIDNMISLAVKYGVWLEDDNVYAGATHNNPNWNVVPVIAGQENPTSISGDTLDQDLLLATLYRAYYASISSADITSTTIPTLNAYANSVQAKILSDSGSSQTQLIVSGGIYPVSHINPGDYLNGAQQCDGLTGYAYHNQAAQTNLSSWTLKATIYPTVLPMPEALVVSNGQDGYSPGGYALGIAGGTNGGPGANVCAYLPGVGWIDSGYALPQTAQWYSLMAVYSAGSLSFYVNGVQTPLVTACVPLAVPPQLTVGASWNSLNRVASRYFIGSIDEIAVYPFALSPTRIAALAAMEVGLADSALGSGSNYFLFDQSTVDDSASTFTYTRLLTDAAPVFSDTITYSLKTIADTYPVIIAQDKFNRLNQSGWGTASDGQLWTHDVGTSGISIVANQGQVTGAATANYLLLGSHTGGMEEGIARFSIDDAGNGIGVCLRAQDGNNLYRARIYTGNFGIVRLNNGSATNLVLSAPFTPSTGVNYWIRFRAYGSQLLAKYWTEPNPEPAAWTLSTTDTTYTSGRVGLFAQIVNSGTIVVDNFYVVDNNLTDQLMVSEQFVAQIAPPFAPELLPSSDSMVWTEGLVYFDSGDQLTLVDTEFIYTQQTPVDFLLPVETFATGLSWSREDDPIVSDAILSTMARTLDIDQLVAPTDICTPNNIMAPIDSLQIMDNQAEALVANLPDPFVIIDATQFTQARSFSNQTTFGQDSVVGTMIPLEVTQLVIAETSAYAIADNPVTLTVLADQIVPILAVSQSDSMLPADTVIPTPVTTPVDTLAISEAASWVTAPHIVDFIALGSDILFDVESISIADSMTIAEQLISQVTEQQADGLTPADSLFDVDIVLPVDQLALIDIFAQATVLSLADTLAATDVIIPFDRPLLVDQLLSGDAITDNVQSIIADALVVAEGQLDQLTIMQTDVTPPALVVVNTLIFFFTTDITLVSDVTFTVETVSLADLSIVSDAVFTPDISVTSDVLFSVEGITKQGTYFPTDHLLPADGFLEAMAEALGDTALVVADAVTSQQANSFTGWVDLLYVTEVLQEVGQLAPVEALGLVESTFYALREVIQGNSLALGGENLSASIILATTDIATQQEKIVSSITSTGIDQCTMGDTSALNSTFVPVEPMVSQETLHPILALSSADILAITEQGVPNALYAIVEQIGGIVEGVVLRVNFVPAEALSVIMQTQTSVTEAMIDVVASIDASMLSPNYQPVDIVAEAEAIAIAAQLKYSETLPLIDVSTTNGMALDSGQLTLAPETDAFMVRLVPIEILSQQDVSTERLSITFPLDNLAVLELDPSFGYGFTDSLYIQELLNGTSQSYMLVYGQILSGQIDGTMLSGKIDGQILSGQIDGVLS